MSPVLVHPISVIIALATALGVFVHDAKLDKMAAAAVPATVLSALAADAIFKSAEKHVHIEAPTVKARSQSALQLNLPKVQPREDDRRTMIQPRKLVYQGGDSNSIWPSV